MHEATYTRDRCLRLHVTNEHDVLIWMDHGVLHMRLDGEHMSFLPHPTDRDGIVLKPFVVEHHRLADPLYQIANHSDEDVTRFALAAFGRLDELPKGHAYTVPGWYSIRIKREDKVIRLV
jgi:hypothetical protein